MRIPAGAVDLVRILDRIIFMNITLQSVPIGPTRDLNIDGEYTHLLRIYFQNESNEERARGVFAPPAYFLFAPRDNSMVQISEKGSGFWDIIMSAAFKNASTSKPVA